MSDYLYKNIEELKIRSGDISEVIALLRKMSLLREDVTPQVFLLLDILLTQVKDKIEKKRILNNVKQVITGKNDQEYQLIWFYRLCLSQLPEMCEKVLSYSDSPLLRVVDKKYNKNDFDIFTVTNLSVSDNKELKKFKLIDRKKLKNLNSGHINPFSLNIFKY